MPLCCFSSVSHLYTRVKALANEDTLLRTHCCRHIVADTNVSPFDRASNICCGHKFCVRDTKKCFWFCSETFCVRNKCFPVCAAHGQQCVRNNMSSFTRALTPYWTSQHLLELLAQNCAKTFRFKKTFEKKATF